MNKRSHLNAFLSLLVLSMLLLTLLTTPALAEASWDIQTVDENGDGHGVSMSLDSKDHPHLCYTAHVDGYYRNPLYLTYASWNGSAWNIQNVTENVGFIGYSSLALDSNNNPHITYEARAHGSLLYASWTGEEWSIQTVDPEGGEGFLVLDSVDTPHIVYGGANGTLRYAVLKGSNWSIQTVDTQKGLKSTPSLALDSNDHPHILYGYSAGNGNTTVKYTMWNGSSWNFQTAISNADVSFGNIALDIRGYPHFTYYTDGLLMYASWNGNAWNTQVVDSITETQDSGFLIFDSNNNPHISYTKGEKYGDEFLMYAEWTGFAWSIQTVDSSSIINLGYLASMALDSSGNPRIGYYGGYHDRYFIASVLYAKLESPLLSASELIVIIAVVVVILTGLILYFKKRKR